MVDLRERATRDALGLQGHEAATPWQPQRAAGVAATSWTASDAVRAAGVDGMIYASRTAPDRWHLVLFAWNEPGHASVAFGGEFSEFHP